MFVDFGADSLDFTLLCWLDLGDSTGRVVASDLRAMIATSLAAAGIEIPFAQRDVHHDAISPIPVRVVSDGTEVAAPRAAPV